MEGLTEDDKAEITKILKRASRFVWGRPGRIEAVIASLEAIRFGTSDRHLDKPVSEHTSITWKDLYEELGLGKFLPT